MKSNNELKDIDIDNCICYCFDDIMRVVGIDFDDILLNEKSYKSILIRNTLCKTFIGAKPLHIRFEKIDGFIKIYDGTKYLILSGPERYDEIYDWMKYIISEKSDITFSISHNFAKMKVDSNDPFLLEKTMTFHDVIMLIKSVFNTDKNSYFYNIFLEKASYELLKI